MRRRHLAVVYAAGVDPSSLRERHAGMVAVHQEIEYRRELLAGAVYSIFSRVLEAREKVIRIEHEMRDDETGEVAATMTITGVHIDTRERKAKALPPEVLTRARQMLASMAGENGLAGAGADHRAH